MSAHVAVLGLGAMGLPMASWLAAEGSTVTGFDVSPERLDLAAQATVTPAATAAAACRDATVVVCSVRDGAQLESVLFGTDGAADTMKPGSVVIVTSTVGSAVVASLAARLADHGIGTVDAPVSGGPVRAGCGDLLIMVGGDDAAISSARPVLDALASALVVVGGVGAGQDMKTVNQLLCGVHTAAAAEALALADRLGLDLDAAIDVLGQGAAASFMLADRGPRIAQRLRGESPPLRSRLDVIAKDMGIVGDLTRTLRVATPVAGATEQLYRIGMAADLHAEDDSIVSTLLAAADGAR